MKHSSGVCLCRVAVAVVAAPLCDPILPHSNRSAALKFWGQTGPVGSVGVAERKSGATGPQRAVTGDSCSREPWKESIQRPGRASRSPVLLRSSRTVRKELQGASGGAGSG